MLVSFLLKYCFSIFVKTASNTQQLGTKIEENCDFKEILQKIQTHTKVYTTETKANG